MITSSIIKINSIEQLKDLLLESEDGYLDAFVLLQNNCRSSKHISYDGETFFILHLIDDSEEEILEKDVESSCLAKYIEKGILYLY